jgi:hypothetical protein
MSFGLGSTAAAGLCPNGVMSCAFNVQGHMAAYKTFLTSLPVRQASATLWFSALMALGAQCVLGLHVCVCVFVLLCGSWMEHIRKQYT